MGIRSLRNNNPGNLRVGIAWEGLMPRERMDSEQASETAFCVFITPQWGFRALCVDLINSERLDQLRCVLWRDELAV